MVTMPPEEECDKRHRAAGLRLVLAGAGSVAAIVLSIGLLSWNSQVSMAEKLEQRIRINEQFRAEVGVKLDAISSDLKDVKKSLASDKK